jgi:hypothetical protein
MWSQKADMHGCSMCRCVLGSAVCCRPEQHSILIGTLGSHRSSWALPRCGRQHSMACLPPLHSDFVQGLQQAECLPQLPALHRNRPCLSTGACRGKRKLLPWSLGGNCPSVATGGHGLGEQAQQLLVNLIHNLEPVRQEVARIFAKHRHITTNALAAFLLGLSRRTVVRQIHRFEDTLEVKAPVVKAGTGRKRRACAVTQQTTNSDSMELRHDEALPALDADLFFGLGSPGTHSTERTVAGRMVEAIPPMSAKTYPTGAGGAPADEAYPPAHSAKAPGEHT